MVMALGLVLFVVLSVVLTVMVVLGVELVSVVLVKVYVIKMKQSLMMISNINIFPILSLIE